MCECERDARAGIPPVCLSRTHTNSIRLHPTPSQSHVPQSATGWALAKQTPDPPHNKLTPHHTHKGNYNFINFLNNKILIVGFLRCCFVIVFNLFPVRPRWVVRYRPPQQQQQQQQQQQLRTSTVTSLWRALSPPACVGRAVGPGRAQACRSSSRSSSGSSRR